MRADLEDDASTLEVLEPIAKGLGRGADLALFETHPLVVEDMKAAKAVADIDSDRYVFAHRSGIHLASLRFRGPRARFTIGAPHSTVTPKRGLAFSYQSPAGCSSCSRADGPIGWAVRRGEELVWSPPDSSYPSQPGREIWTLMPSGSLRDTTSLPTRRSRSRPASLIAVATRLGSKSSTPTQK